MGKEVFVTKSSIPPYEEYIEAIRPLWDTHILTNMGVYHRKLEQQLAEFLCVPKISLTVNGHMALELTIQAFNFPEGGEVITTPFTFISTTHAIVRNNLRPVFCDVKETDGTLDETKLEALITPRTVAILPVHVYGNICNVDEIARIAEKYNLRVIYDAAHAFGETNRGEPVGNFGDASIFSFHATKVFHTVEGGAVVCKNSELYKKLYDLKNFGIRGEELVSSVGANAKMNELCAVMGLLNLKYFRETVMERARLVRRYREKLSGVRGLQILLPEEEIERSYGYFPILLTEDCSLTRDAAYQELAEHGIHARKYFYPLTADQACFKNQYASAELPVARKLSNQVLVLPLYEGLDDETVDEICGELIC